MAAPHIAGIVAQLFQADPTATPAQIEAALKGTAYRYTDGAAYTSGRRLHDVLRQGHRPGRRRRRGRAPHRSLTPPRGHFGQNGPSGSTWNTAPGRRELRHGGTFSRRGRCTARVR